MGEEEEEVEDSKRDELFYVTFIDFKWYLFNRWDENVKFMLIYMIRIVN